MTTSDILPSSTRIWIYQSNQPFQDVDVPQIKAHVQNFAQEWISHNRQLRAHGDVLHNRFIVLMVDESQADASGCSIDKSVYFLKALQAEYGVDLFDRMHFSFKQNDQVNTVSREEFAKLYAAGTINDDTLVFDTLVSNKGDFDQAFDKPLGKSWHKRMV